jgi:hypothetical protein
VAVESVEALVTYCQPKRVTSLKKLMPCQSWSAETVMLLIWIIVGNYRVTGYRDVFVVFSVPPGAFPGIPQI